MILSITGRPIAWAGALLAVAACGEGDGSTGDAGEPAQPYIVATTGIWADVASMVACDGALDVRTLVPAGGDPHAYEPSLRDREMLDAAVLVVSNGLGLEALLDDTIDDVAAGGAPVFAVAEHVDTIPIGEHGGVDDEGDYGHDEDEHADGADDGHVEDEHGDGGDDPHVWFDPTRVADALPALGAAIVAAGGDPDATGDCVSSAGAELEALDADAQAQLAAVAPERRLLVTNHDSLGYFADRYGFEVLGTILPSASTLTAANPAQLEALGEDIEAAGVPAIFTESLSDDTDAAALADRLDVEIVELYTDALGDADSPAATYADLLRADADLIAAALAE